MNEKRPAKDRAPSTTTTLYSKNISATSLHARCQTARRLPPLDCGHADPWLCRCGLTDDPTEGVVDAYAAALAYLESHGLTGAPFIPELRALWRRGADERRMVRDTTSRWAVA